MDGTLWLNPRNSWQAIAEIRDVTALRLIISVLLLCGAALAVWHLAGAAGVRGVLSSLTLTGVALSAGFLLLGTLLAALRLKVVARGLGYPLTFRDAAAALGAGLVGGSLFFQFAGQLLGRAAVLSRRSVPIDGTVLLTGYERILGALVGLTLAVSGALYLFGRVTLNLTNAAGDLPKMLAVGVLAVVLGWLLAWGPLALRMLSALLVKATFVKFAHALALSVAVQCATLAGYVCAGHMLSPSIPLDQLAAASTIVMLAASLPISLGGWGVREVSAVVALGAIGVPVAEAITVGAIVGVFSLAAAAGLAVAYGSSALLADRPAAAAPTPDYAAVIDFLVPLCVATAVFFQVYVPLRDGPVNVNLADPFAILGGSLAVIRMRALWPRSILLWLGALSLVVLAGWINGLSSFGWHEWAATKMFGWLVLLGYASCGALIVQRENGLRLLLLTFASAGIAGCVVEYAGLLGASFGRNTTFAPIAGLSQNRNAFAFILIMVLIAIFVARPAWRVPAAGLVLAVAILTGSRAGWGAIIAVACALAILDRDSRRPIALSFLIACVLMLALFGAGASWDRASSDSSVVTRILVMVGTEYAGSADRIASIMGGLRLFMEHPIIGAGLGAHAYQTAAKGSLLVIHSTPVFILAEFGLVGFAVVTGCVVAAVRLAWPASREPRLLVLLALAALGVMGLAHELLYQRAFWLLLGAGVAAVQCAGAAEPTVRPPAAEPSR